jgi:hypothetical protein
MSLKEYDVLDDPATAAGKQLEHMSNVYPARASRLVIAIEDFIEDDGASGEQMAAGSSQPSEEVYLVPPTYVLNHLPDAAGLIYVDHAARRIEFIEFFDTCGGPGYPWGTIKTKASAALRRP